ASAPYTDNRADAFYAIQCADSLVPTSDAVYHNLAITEDRQVPGFGRLIVYDMMPCASWPTMHTDAYDGPWNRSRTPILVINAVHDPITPIWGAEAAVDELGNAASQGQRRRPHQHVRRAQRLPGRRRAGLPGVPAAAGQGHHMQR